uniref:RxLR effector protein n=1 Tax=Phytophthora sojae TaxID=67593 RepID=G1FSA6_PHYSO|nr:Avh233 [Phytophthora sojae]
MRASYVLLAVAALLSACDATADTKTQAGTTHNELLNRRALRLHGATTETRASEDDEERIFSVSKILGLKKASESAPAVEKALKKVVSLEKTPALHSNLFLADDIERMTRDKNFKIDRWEQWYVEKLSLGDIRKELNKLGLKNNPDYKKLLVDYINVYKARVDELLVPAVEKAEKAGKKIQFGTNSETTKRRSTR